MQLKKKCRVHDAAPRKNTNLSQNEMTKAFEVGQSLIGRQDLPIGLHRISIDP